MPKRRYAGVIATAQQEVHETAAARPVHPGDGRRMPDRGTGPADALVCVAPWQPGKQACRARAIGSAGERLVHTEEVTGSIPVSPTR